MDQIAKYFGKNSIGDISFAHAINSKRLLRNAIANPGIDFLEVDISLSDDKQPIAAHYHNESDLPLTDLLNNVKYSKKGIKLDFNDQNAVIPCLKALASLRVKQPVILNADVLNIKGAPSPIVQADFFIQACSKYYPIGLISVGWRTEEKSNSIYSSEDVNNMLEACKGVDRVTFAVRASMLPASWSNVKHLLENETHTLTVWDSKPIDGSLKKWVAENTDKNRCFYDLNLTKLPFWTRLMHRFSVKNTSPNTI